MLRDLTRDDWLAILGLPEGRVPQALLLRGTRNLKTQYERHRAYFDDVVEVGSPNGILEDVLVGSVGGLRVGYASVYGAPMASEVVHVFGVMGTSLVVQTGCCGALADDLGPGDLIVAIEAYCGEGASQYYRETDAKIVGASPAVVRSPAVSAVNGGPVHFGRIYTTCALFAEGRTEVEEWFAMGCVAADMETAATFAVAEHFGMDRVSILFAFDNPRRAADLVMEDAEKDQLRAAGNERMIALAFAVIREYFATGAG